MNKITGFMEVDLQDRLNGVHRETADNDTFIQAPPPKGGAISDQKGINDGQRPFMKA